MSVVIRVISGDSRGASEKFGFAAFLKYGCKRLPLSNEASDHDTDYLILHSVINEQRFAFDMFVHEFPNATEMESKPAFGRWNTKHQGTTSDFPSHTSLALASIAINGGSWRSILPHRCGAEACSLAPGVLTNLVVHHPKFYTCS